MKNELDNQWDRIEQATGEDQRMLFVNFCVQVIQLKEEGVLDEEKAASYMFRGVGFRNLIDSPECNAIIDITGTAKLPREVSYAQPMGQWDAKTADQIKEREWKELVAAVEHATSKG